VLHSILGTLSDDKHTLAQCMRVSSTFNALAAPLLYRSVIIKSDNKAYIPPPPMSTEVIRLSPDRASLQHHVREIHWAYHGKTQCRLVPRERYRVSLLSITSDLNETQWVDLNQCYCIEEISPRKLVIKAPELNWHIIDDLVPFPEIDIVSILCDNPEGGAGRMGRTAISGLYDIIPTTARMVYVCWSDPRASPSSTSLMRYVVRNFIQFCGRLRMTAVSRPGPKDIVLVNIESVVNDLLIDTDRQNKSLAEAATCAYKREYLKLIELCRRLDEMPPVEGAEEVETKFISMKTYLAEYEWRDVLSEEQARPWLDFEDHQQKGKREFARPSMFVS
jgi:hypothetical protein